MIVRNTKNADDHVGRIRLNGVRALAQNAHRQIRQTAGRGEHADEDGDRRPDHGVPGGRSAREHALRSKCG